MKRLQILAGTCCAVLLATTAVHADEKRGFYFDVGFGLGGTSYGDDVDKVLDDLDDEIDGIDHIVLSLDLAMGGAVRPNLYLVGSVSGFADRYYNSDDMDEYLQLNTYLFGAGVRYYPLPSQKHLLLGADLGLARMRVRTSEAGYGEVTSDDGFGFKLLAAYDIDWTLRGPTLQVGAQLMSASIEDVNFRGFAVFAKFAFK
jgi:hypothetical protein